MFQRTTAVNKLLQLNKRVRVVPGGTWAGKTYDIIALEIDYAMKNPNSEFEAIGETIPSVKSGPLKDFKEILEDTKRWRRDQWNATDRIYTFANGSKMQFSAYENEDKAKQAGKRKRRFLNEANTIPKAICDALMIRTEDVIWLDYNPTARFWVNDDLEGKPHVDWLTLTYRDNNALPQSIMEELQRRREKAKTSTYWENWCRVYLDGQIGSLEGVCIPDWKEIDQLPQDEGGKLECRLLGFGLDFGYSQDPCVVVACYKWNDAYIFDEVVYQKGLLNADLYRLIKDTVGSEWVYADHAEPKSIDELSAYGLNIIGAEKGRDSIMYGVNLLNQETIYVTKRSTNLIRDLMNYVYAKNKQGETLAKPIDAFADGPDAMRYVFISVANKQGQGTYFIH